MSELLSVSLTPDHLLHFFYFYVIKLNISVFYSKTVKYFLAYRNPQINQ